MDDESLIKELLRNEFPDECDLVGNSNLNDVVLFVSSGTPPKQIVKDVSGGNDLNFIEAIELLAQMATLAKTLLEIYGLLEKSREDNTQENEQKATETTEIIKKIVDFIRKQID